MIKYQIGVTVWCQQCGVKEVAMADTKQAVLLKLRELGWNILIDEICPVCVYREAHQDRYSELGG